MFVATCLSEFDDGFSHGALVSKCKDFGLVYFPSDGASSCMPKWAPWLILLPLLLCEVKMCFITNICREFNLLFVSIVGECWAQAVSRTYSERYRHLPHYYQQQICIVLLSGRL